MISRSRSPAPRTIAASRFGSKRSSPYLVLDHTYAEKAELRRGQVRDVAAAPSPAPSGRHLERPPLRRSSARSPPTTPRSTSKARRKWAAKTSPKSPTASPASKTASTCVYTYGVKRGRIDLHTFVDAASTQAAKLFGLFPRKGTIALGSDADLVVYDPDYRGKISQKTQQMNVDYNAFEGWELEGRPSARHRPRQSPSPRRPLRRPTRPRPIPRPKANPLLNPRPRGERRESPSRVRVCGCRLRTSGRVARPEPGTIRRMVDAGRGIAAR